MQNVVLINSSRIYWPCKIVICHLWVSQTICFRMLIIFKQKCRQFQDSTQTMLSFKFGWGAVPPYMHSYVINLVVVSKKSLQSIYFRTSKAIKIYINKHNCYNFTWKVVIHLIIRFEIPQKYRSWKYIPLSNNPENIFHYFPKLCEWFCKSTRKLIKIHKIVKIASKDRNVWRHLLVNLLCLCCHF